jgi:transposase
MAESNRQRRFFPDAFKLEAVAAICGGHSVSAVAAELGLLDRLVRAWLRRAEGRLGDRSCRHKLSTRHSDQRGGSER